MLKAVSDHAECNIALVAQQAANLFRGVAVIDMVTTFTQRWASTDRAYAALGLKAMIEFLCRYAVQAAEILVSVLSRSAGLAPPFAVFLAPRAHVGATACATYFDVLVGHVRSIRCFVKYPVMTLEVTP